MSLSRRDLLTSTGPALLLSSTPATARIIAGGMPWAPDAGAPPAPVRPGPWQFFTPEEGAAVEVLVDRLIPPDPETPGAKDAGCAVFIDRQLVGPYGISRALYMRPPRDAVSLLHAHAAPGHPGDPRLSEDAAAGAQRGESRPAVVQSTDPTTLLHIVLHGTRNVATDAAPTSPAMPAMGWKLSDDQIAAVLTYIRNSWGNAAAAVAGKDAAKLRAQLVEQP